MGYSMTWMASKKIAKLTDHCLKHSDSQNTWTTNGKTYFFEISRRDQKDGGVRASVHKFVGKNLAKTAGYISIDGNGKINSAPVHIKEILNA